MAEGDPISRVAEVYKVAQHFHGRREFVLSAAGHIQSLISPPPGHVKAKYFLNSELAATADEWLKDATGNAGSWWPHWQAWIEAQDAGRVKPRRIGGGKLKAIEPAPGRYVKVSA